MAMATNIQIPEALFLDLYSFFEGYEDIGDISTDDGKRLARIKGGLSQKAAAYMARQTYRDYMRCHADEKDEKLQNYLYTKKMYQVRGARHGNV